MPTLLTLPEFAAIAATAVRASGVAPDNRQAKAVPAERMVRYYTARGLLPRPGTRGRALTYGRTHLLHLVAIKRLQGRGLSLEEIAAHLDGMAPTELESLAAIPPGVVPDDLGDPEPPTSAATPSRAAGRFWATAPAPPPETVDTPPEPQAVRLCDGVTLLIDGRVGPLPPLDTLRQAAAPLLDLLAPRKDNRE